MQFTPLKVMLSTHVQFNSRKMSALKKEKRIIFTTKKKINNLAIEYDHVSRENKDKKFDT